MNLIRLYGFEFDSMPEYLRSLPTGTTLWKMWKRFNGKRWIVGQYVPHVNPNKIGIRWFEIMFRSGPIPID